MAQGRTIDDDKRRISLIRKGQVALIRLRRLYSTISLADMKTSLADMKKLAKEGSSEDLARECKKREKLLDQYEAGWGACEAWWDGNKAHFLRVAKTILGNLEDSEEAVSWLHVVVWQNVAPKHFDPWCRKVLKNRCFDIIRMRKKQPVGLNWTSSEGFRTPFEEHPEAIRHAITNSADFNHFESCAPSVSKLGPLLAKLQLDDLCKHLDQDEKSLIEHHLKGDSHATVARLLNISAGNVRVRLHDAIEHLRELSGLVRRT